MAFVPLGQVSHCLLCDSNALTVTECRMCISSAYWTGSNEHNLVTT